MNCKETQQFLVAYIEGTLEETTRQAVEANLEKCDSCQQAYRELRILMDHMDQYEPKLPTPDLELNVAKMLQKEQKQLNGLASKKSRNLLRSLKPLMQVAAIFVLFLGGYFYSLQHIPKSNKAELNGVKAQLAEVLLESRSASKRIQAVNYTKELENTDVKTLKVLIDLMAHDKHINVRLSAASALAHFSEDEIVREALIAQLSVEENPNMQVELIQLLIDLKEDRILPRIKEMMSRKDTPSFIKTQIQSQIPESKLGGKTMDI